MDAKGCLGLLAHTLMRWMDVDRMDHIENKQYSYEDIGLASRLHIHPHMRSRRESVCELTYH